jgi:hypothetical protein
VRLKGGWYSRCVVGTRPYLLAAVLAVAGCDKSKPAPEVPAAAEPTAKGPVDAAVLKGVEALGRELYARDVLAASASDVLVERASELADGWGVQGWLTFAEGGPQRVEFIGVRGEHVATVFEVTFDDEGTPSGVPVVPPRTVEGEVLARWKARQTALEHSPQCTPAVNSVVLPLEDDGWLVYLIPGTVDPGMVILGGHVRVHVGPDGGVRDAKPLTKSCLVNRNDNVPEGASMAGMIVSHVLDPHPREHHVFASLLYGISLFVVTEDAMWSVSDGHIEFVEDPRS